MVPPPCARSGSQVLGGDPVQVIVRVDEKAIHILEAKITWKSPAHPMRQGTSFAKLPLDTPAARVAEQITAAAAKRRASWRWCPRCQRAREPEHMLAGVCHGCAEKVLGIVF